MLDAQLEMKRRREEHNVISLNVIICCCYDKQVCNIAVTELPCRQFKFFISTIEIRFILLEDNIPGMTHMLDKDSQLFSFTTELWCKAFSTNFTALN